MSFRPEGEIFLNDLDPSHSLGMTRLGPKSLREQGRFLEGVLGESLILSGLLRTIRNEISPDASHKKLLQIYEGVEECCYCLVELSHNLSM
jgi:hypothetical protein